MNNTLLAKWLKQQKIGAIELWHTVRNRLRDVPVPEVGDVYRSQYTGNLDTVVATEMDNYGVITVHFTSSEDEDRAIFADRVTCRPLVFPFEFSLWKFRVKAQRRYLISSDAQQVAEILKPLL